SLCGAGRRRNGSPLPHRHRALRRQTDGEIRRGDRPGFAARGIGRWARAGNPASQFHRRRENYQRANRGEQGRESFAAGIHGGRGGEKPMSVRALVLCGDGWHPAETVRRGLGALEDCGFDYEFVDDAAKWSAEMMAKFSVVVLAKANLASLTVESPWLTLDSQSAFPDFVQRGNGLVVVHAGTSRYEKLPAMHELIGGAFVRHPDQCAE